MQTISIGDFRANLLKYLEIANVGEPISITSNGGLLATISAPIQQRDEAKKAINSADKQNTLIIADISIWEISMLLRKKRLEIDSTPARFINF